LRHYECYFDGSYTPLISGFAYFVKENGKIIHSNTYREKLQSSQHAETKALFMLLNYIRDNIEEGSKVEIYGDDKHLIDRMSIYTVENYLYYETRLLYDTIEPNYKLSLTHIPGKRNKIAHNLTKAVYKSSQKITQINDIPAEDGVISCFERKLMVLEEIYVPDIVKKCKLPGSKMYNKRLRYCQQYGHDHKSKTIRIDNKGRMLAGYITYLLLKDSGISSCYVDVLTNKMSLAVA